MRGSAEGRSFCFGKLPLAGDFIRGDAPAPEFAELDRWIELGMVDSLQRLGADFQRQFDELPPTRFLWTAGRGTAIAGWWLASRDAVGRRYPFVLAARITGVPHEDYLLLPTALAAFFDDARQLLDGAFAGLDVVGTIARAQGLPCRIELDRARADLPAALRAVPAGASWSGLDASPALLLHDLEQSTTTTRPPQYSLRWPTRGEPIDLCFWLGALARFGHAAPRLLLWHGDASRPGVARAALDVLQPRLFKGMLFFDQADDDAFDLGRAFDDPRRAAAANARFGAAATSTTQADALAAIARQAADAGRRR